MMSSLFRYLVIFYYNDSGLVFYPPILKKKLLKRHYIKVVDITIWMFLHTMQQQFMS